MTQLMVMSSDELEALYELHHVDYVLYLWLRLYMDYATGVVGLSRGISRQMLLERCYVPAEQGRGAQSVSVSALRMALGRLERRGLLARIGGGEKLVFRMPIAQSALLRSKKQRPNYDRTTTGQAQPDQQPSLGESPCGFTDDSCPEQRPNHDRPSDSEEQPTSGIRYQENNQSSSPSTKSSARACVGGGVGDDDSIPDVPTQPQQWMQWFNERYQTGYSPVSLRDRKQLWPVFNRWIQAGLSLRHVEDAVRRAQDGASEPIVSLPLYVDRVIASEVCHRNSKDSRGQRRLETLEGLTGSARGGYGDTFDAAAVRAD